uniref:Uncharacterized protein n=1 Tax=Candidatus Kentrum sp. DK TaxID=2126562 RepID=A0A450TF19_9GAMM|nr:MAG: hypothetical protein BECKDK2373B_GA0170837_11539 [Candidatus Kentron sp. DK]
MRNSLAVLPSLVEAAVFALEAEQPIYLAGGYGGVTLDMVRALDIDDCDWFAPLPDELASDPRLTDGLERLARIYEERGGKLPDNGLDDLENRQLAATHRPSEIAALIGLGLGRRFGEDNVVTPLGGITGDKRKSHVCLSGNVDSKRSASIAP